MNCRFCNTPLNDVFIDLGNSPASNSFLTAGELQEPEVYFPLKVYTCANCYLVQVDEYKKSDAIFNNSYVYYSSFSKSWLQHAAGYCEMMVKRFGYNTSSLVMEVASNDGYLLQYFNQQHIPVLGIEPTSNTAEVAKGKGIDTVVDFFGVRLATKLATGNRKADLLLGNNVLAHVPDINDFVQGMKIVLKDEGVITMEFPHLLQLVENNQFDTIYHEHFSYLSLHTVKQIFEAAGLQLFDVEEIPTHGGSLRIFAKHIGDATKAISGKLSQLLAREEAQGMLTMNYYQGFAKKAFVAKLEFSRFLLDQKAGGNSVAAYGAAAKGNTLLNYCGIKNDLIDFVVDANPHKQNKYLPGSHIKVCDEEYLKEMKPQYVIIFPWNIKEEIMEQLDYIKSWGGKFVVPIPSLSIID